MLTKKLLKYDAAIHPYVPLVKFDHIQVNGRAWIPLEMPFLGV